MIRQDQLRLIRVAILDKTMKEVADELGVNRMRVKRYEIGEQQAPQGYLNDFASFYGIGFDTVDKIREFEKTLTEIQRTRLKR